MIEDANLPLVRLEDTKEGFNVVIDGRWAAYFPMSQGEQVAFLVEHVNRAHREKIANT